MDPEELRGVIKKALVISAFFVVGLVFFILGWRTLLVVYLLLVGAVSMLAILIQSGRGGGLASSLGGLGGDSLLGVHSATPIAKATYVMLALFIFLGVLLARMGGPAARSSGLAEETPRVEAPAEEPEAGEPGAERGGMQPPAEGGADEPESPPAPESAPEQGSPPEEQ